jgi:hypothetical protein
VSPKKRSSGKRGAHRHGLSGNPQRRAEQLRQKQSAIQVKSAFSSDTANAAEFRDLAYRLAGGASPAPWWRESHERILARARALAWPSRLVDVETQACQIVGDEFYDHFESPDKGLHPAQWLRALAEKTGAALRADLTEGAGHWQQLWALLRGLALTTPQMLSDIESETARSVREQFPDIKDPQKIALAEAGKVAEMLAKRGLTAVDGDPVAGCRPAGEPLVARDVYGSRFLLVAPFAYAADAPDHWYAWDVDLCWITVIVGAGAFGSAEDALGEWRDAVGPAASGAALASCPAGVPAQLLAPALQTGPLAEMMQGFEPRELIREYYRMRRRAQVLTRAAGAREGAASFGTDDAHDAFLDWYATRHGDTPKAVTEAVDTILEEWGPQTYPDERSFYACSPHRIEMTAHLIHESFDTDYADPALQLLPEWTQWCVEKSGLDGDAAARSREAARTTAAALADDEAGEPGDEDDEADEKPFRRRE